MRIGWTDFRRRVNDCLGLKDAGFSPLDQGFETAQEAPKPGFRRINDTA